MKNVAQQAPKRQTGAGYFVTEPGQPQREVHLTGQSAWVLGLLIATGRAGLTAADLPAGVRVAAVVLKLRRAGVPILTINEPNTGPFGGSHARYTLAANVEVAQ
ncbi:MAG: hypothetical protein GC146_06445 [Limimaricola sp.]|uniref:winged helix domain-containing protein n=1 Tax=Limimaricola sp. TaxID=2211665 RepID=UPI001DEECA65|nr:hypothetical protein [Limimaricola sp.]MBI1416847.1 hypothetical protein [Limimaricola sp.]